MDNLMPEGWKDLSETELNTLFDQLKLEATELAASNEGQVSSTDLSDLAASVKAHVEACSAIKAEIASRESADGDLSASLALLNDFDVNAEESDVVIEDETVEETVSEELEVTEPEAVETETVVEAEAETEVTDDAELETDVSKTDSQGESVDEALSAKVSSDEATDEVTEEATELEAEVETEEVVEAVVETELEAEEVEAEVETEVVVEAEAEVEAEKVETEEVAETELEVTETEATGDAVEVESELEVEVVAETEEELTSELEANSQSETADEDLAEDSQDELNAEAEVETEEVAEAEVEIEDNTETETETSDLETSDESLEEKKMADAENGAVAPEFFAADTDKAGHILAPAGALTKEQNQPFANMSEFALEAAAAFQKFGGARNWSNLNPQSAGDIISLGTTNMEADVATSKMGELSAQNGEDRNFLILSDVVNNYKADLMEGMQDDSDFLVASGGICAPFQTDYSFFRLAKPQAGLSGLPKVRATRGGIKFIVPPDFKAARQGIATVTCEEDANGYLSTPANCGGPGTTPDKPCVCVECPTTQECCVTAIPWCVRWGNFNYYTFPELVANFMQDMNVAFALTKETLYLDQIMAQSTVATAPANLSAIRDVIGAIRRAATNYRGRHSMNPTDLLDLYAPAWILDVIKQDLANSTYGSDPLAYLRISDEQIASVLRVAGVRLSFYHGSPSTDQTGDMTTIYPNLPAGTTSQHFDADQIDGAVINSYPSKAVMFMFAPGTFVELDGGSLDFGMVRDASLISTNDFIMAAEEFGGICKVGLESLALVVDICPSGAGVGPAPFGTVIC